MDKNTYEKVITGRNLNNIFKMDELVDVENYLLHVETINGTKNNFIISMDDDNVEVSDLYVSATDFRDVQIV
ncbi:MAG: hypothetical protein ACOZCL_01695 [Bacillota bacterium]